MDVRGVVRVLDAAAATMFSGGELDERMRRALDLVCAFTRWPLGHVYLLDAGTGLQRPHDVWHAESPARFSRFIAETMREPLMPGVGLPGRVVASQGAVWMADLHADPRAPAAAECGIAAGFGFPIVGTRGIQGVMEFFPSGPEQPREPLLELLAHIGLEIGNGIDSARALEALRASRVRLADAERLGRIGTWRYQVREDMLDWSDELRLLYGLERAAAPTTFDEFLARVHPDDVERVRSSIERSIDSCQPFEHEYRLVIGPDDLRWAHARGEVVTAEAGRATLLAGYCQDVTERRRREEEIQSSRRLLLEAERMARLGSWTWDLRTNVVSGSEEIRRIFGIDGSEPGAASETFISRIHPDDRDRVLATMIHRAQSLELIAFECRAMLPDGTVRWLDVRGQVSERVDGIATQFTGYTQDITERRLAEEERAQMETRLHQSQRLESLGQLAGGVAHDFNNLLTAILSYSAFVADGLTAMAESTADPVPGQLLADVHQVERAAQRAAELTKRLLTFGRREVVRPAVISLNDVVREVEDLLRRTLGTHIELTTALAPDLWPLWADAGQIEQVLVNLAVNARDAMPGGGRLTIETVNVELDRAGASAMTGLSPGRHVRLRVSDTGHGMPKDVVERAFEPFFTTKARGCGSGLGLATVHGIVAQGGGSIHIDSAVGVGTVLTALWPATARVAATPSAQPKRRADVRDRGRTVLVVDDEPALRDIAQRTLEAHGYIVMTADTGVEAIEIARAHPGRIDVLLTDVIMPGMVGQEVAASVKAIRPGIGVVFMSGYASMELASNGLLDTRTLLLEKPFTEEELLAVVGTALELAEARSDSAET